MSQDLHNTLAPSSSPAVASASGTSASSSGQRQSHYRICPLCEACCGLTVTTEGQRVISIRGAEQDPFSHGYLCPKAYALKDLHEDPDRLRTPLVRKNGELVAASWEEAFAAVEAGLMGVVQRYGRQAVALSFGNPVVHKLGLMLAVPRLAKALGSPNVFSASTLDQMPRQLASAWMYGSWLSVPVPDIERTQWLLVIGANPAVSNGSMWTVPNFRGKAKALRARGGKLVVIDPRKSETAELADEHLFIRPGGDVYLLAAMANALFAHGWVNMAGLASHVDAHALGQLQAALTNFTPQAAAAHAGVTADQITRLAREFAQAPSAAIYGRIGVCTQRFGTAASWLIDVLMILTGRLDAPGGALFPVGAAFAANTQGQPGMGKGITTGRHKSRVSGAPEVWGELPMNLMAEEILTPGPGQVKALITVASNPALSAPGGERINKALAGLEFMVSLDLYLTETTQHAHVVLPGTSPLTHSHYDIAFSQLAWRNMARYSGPVLAPEPGAMPEWEVMLKLAAIAAGHGAQTDVHATDEAALRAQLAPLAGEQLDALMQALSTNRGPERWLDLALRTGPYGEHFGRQPEGLSLAKLKAASAEQGSIDLGELSPRLPHLLRTATGRIELTPQLLLQDLMKASHAMANRPPAASAPGAQSEGPLILIGRRDVRSNNSWMHNLHTLAKGPQRCTLLMHPQDAQQRGFANGDGLELTGPQGRSVQVTLELNACMAPGVVSLPHGWGHSQPGTGQRLAAQRPGANLNALLDETLRDPLSGNAVLSGTPVSAKLVGQRARALIDETQADKTLV